MKNFKFNVSWLLLASCIGCAIVCLWHTELVPIQADQVKIPLHSVEAIQTELVERGHDIEVDGVWGKQTDLALTIEITKQNFTK